MLEKRSWHEFRKTGLLWFTNSILHLFGYAITIDYDDVEKGIIKEVYPARCKFRGFSEKCNTGGYINITQYLKNNIDKLLEETKE